MAKLSDEEKRVNRLARKYELANKALREFEEENADVMDQLRDLAAVRDAAATELETAVREYRIEAAGMQISISPKREFDGKFLYDHFEDEPDTRDQLVTVMYRVDTKQFDAMQRLGLISGKVADKAIVDINEVVNVRHKPKKFMLG